MKYGYKFLVAFVVLVLCGCPSTSTPDAGDAGTDIVDVPRTASTTFDVLGQ